MAVFKVDISGATKKLNRDERLIGQAGNESITSLAEIGKAYAKAHAPYGTGKTERLIRVLKKQGSNGPYAEIQSPNPTANDGHSRNIAKFNLVLWMHTSPNAEGHGFSNDRQYMFSTRDELTRQKKAIANAQFAKIKTKFN